MFVDCLIIFGLPFPFPLSILRDLLRLRHWSAAFGRTRYVQKTLEFRLCDLLTCYWDLPSPKYSSLRSLHFCPQRIHFWKQSWKAVSKIAHGSVSNFSFISSVVVNPCSYNGDFSFGNQKQNKLVKSGEYDGRGERSCDISCKNCISTVMCRSRSLVLTQKSQVFTL